MCPRKIHRNQGFGGWGGIPGAFYGCFLGNSNANQSQILKKRPSDGNVDVHGLEMPGTKVLF